MHVKSFERRGLPVTRPSAQLHSMHSLELCAPSVGAAPCYVGPRLRRSAFLHKACITLLARILHLFEIQKKLVCYVFTTLNRGSSNSEDIE